MGMFDFIKDAGDKLFGKSDGELSSELNQKVVDSDLGVEGIRVSCNDGCATISGTVPNQMVREKLVLLVGNTSGIDKVDDQLSFPQAAPTPEPVATFYTVKSSDTLSKIAKAQYGDPMQYNQIFEANRPMLTHPDKIYPGQVLRVPQASA